MGIPRMQRMIRLDKIGEWSEMKLAIVGEYAREYAKILHAQDKRGLRLKIYYIDGFSGAGLHERKADGTSVDGSPLQVLADQREFNRYYLIEKDRAKAGHLQELCNARFPDRMDRIFVRSGDCNSILMQEILPGMAWEKFERVLCLLDPYGLHLDWQVVQKMGSGMGKKGMVDLILNFPVLDMNMNILLKDVDKASPAQLARMDLFWGDDSWRGIVFRPNLFGGLEKNETQEKKAYAALADAYRTRLLKEAGFKCVAQPLLVSTPGNNAPLYYLFFASPKEVARKIANHIFHKYGNK